MNKFPFALTLAVASLASLAACNTMTPVYQPGGPVVGITRESDLTTATSSDVSPTDKIAAPRAPHEQLFVLALRDIDLTDAQRRTIDEELKKVVAQAARSDNPAPFELVAKSVRAGKIDVPTVRASFDANRPKESKNFVASLVVLHDTLTPAQRQELVDAMEKRQLATSPAPIDVDGTSHQGFAPPSMMRMLADLNLSDAQKDLVAKAFAAQPKPSAEDHEKRVAEISHAREESRARLHTFVNDVFDADAFMAPPTNPNGAPSMSHLVDDLSVVVALLTQEQREKLASRIEQGPISQTPAPEHPEHPEEASATP